MPAPRSRWRAWAASGRPRSDSYSRATSSGLPAASTRPPSSRSAWSQWRLQRVHRVRHQHPGPARLPELREGLGALLLKPGVADREDLVEQQQVGVDVHHRREAEPGAHSGRVVLELQVLEVLELRELEDLRVARPRLARLEPHHHRVHDDVVVGLELVVEADAQLDDRGQATGRPDLAGVRPVDAGHQLQQRALAGAVAPGDPEELAATDPEADVAQNLELGRRRAETREQSLAQRVNPPGGQPKALAEVVDGESGAPGFIGWEHTYA